jgi:tetratricopeptide (TPR) repeat protein
MTLRTDERIFDMAIFSKHEATPLTERIQKARREGRTQQALELSKQLAKQQPSPEHQELLRAVTFERGCQLLDGGKAREAMVVFQNALAFEAPAEFRAKIAAKLAQAGDVATALSLFSQLPDCPERAVAFAQAVDAALIKGASGRAQLPPDLHAAFDAVVRAFELVEKQQDDAAREALQAIGLSSPFLEWKVMLRGLIAYYQNDDARALDNWQRLDPARQPLRLVAPYRFHIDPAFRAAQPEATRKRLQGIIDRAGNFGPLSALRGIEKLLGPWETDRAGRQAFRAASDFVRAFGAAQPQLVACLAQLFYKKVAEDGLDNDVELYRATFPPPADDPKLLRLSAISAEHDQAPLAVDRWLDYEKHFATVAHRFPGTTAALAHALVWEHLGSLVRLVMDEYHVPKHVPPPVECYRKSIALVPGRLRPHKLLFESLKSAPKKKKEAVAAAKILVAQFPEHAPAWEYLGDAFLTARKASDSVEAFRAALKANPMNGELRRKLADALWARALQIATGASRAKGGLKPEKYRPLLEEALRVTEGNLIARLAEWALLETRFGHADFAQELIAKGESQPQARLALPLSLYIGAQLDKKGAAEHLQMFHARWQLALGEAPKPTEVAAALDALVHFDCKALRGKKELVDALLPKLTKRPLDAFSEGQLLHIGQRLVDLALPVPAKKVADNAVRRFPKSPYFHLLQFDIALAGRPRGHWKARSELDTASKLTLAMPREQQELALAEIQKREPLIAPPDDFARDFMNMFNRFNPFDDFDDDDMDDDDEFDGW